jgi:hypothetical protein
LDWISWGKEGEDLAGLEEVSGKGKKEKKKKKKKKKMNRKKKKKNRK